MVNKICVFDIDGTLANNEHRTPYVRTKPKNWKAFNAGLHLDSVYLDMLYLYNVLSMHDMHTMLLCTGRENSLREATCQWLKENGIVYDRLYMRAAQDYRSDSIVKVELLQVIRQDFGEPFLWVDDRDQVVKAIREAGVRVLQCREGNF